MSSLTYRLNEGCGEQPSLLWDSVWNPLDGQGDWALAGADEAQNRGGLKATNAIHTAVLIALFTDKRVPDEHPLRYLADNDPRGWWGDGVDVRADLGEAPLGSLLWLLQRAPLDASTEQWAIAFAQEALYPLIAQQVVSKIEVEATANKLKNRLEMLVRLYGRDGKLVYDERFQSLWDQISPVS
jgi:phage gp46-like protein